jgi:hypothetical protein
MIINSCKVKVRLDSVSVKTDCFFPELYGAIVVTLKFRYTGKVDKD